jgi:hypothetical protein
MPDVIEILVEESSAQAVTRIGEKRINRPAVTCLVRPVDYFRRDAERCATGTDPARRPRSGV